MSWTFDMPSGAFKNHALSTNIRKEAMEDVQTMRFFRAEPGYGKHKGENLTITRVLQLPRATRIGETSHIPSGRPAIETKQVSVSKWAYKVPVTEFERHLTYFNIMDPIQAALRDQITLTMDVMCADTLQLTPIKYVPETTGYTLTTNGTAGATSDRNLEIQDLRAIRDELKGALKCPMFKGNRYVGILSTRAARGIKNDSEYKDWQAPTTRSPFISGYLTNVEGFDLYETNHDEAFADLVGSSTTTGEAVFFGMDAGALLQVMAPELRMGIPTELGTFQEVGWVGEFDAFLPWESASYARVVHVTSL